METSYGHPTELYCSPRAYKYAEPNSTCFSYGELKLLAKEFNKQAMPGTLKITGRTKKDLVSKLLKAYKKICNKHQFCWIKQTLTDQDQDQEKIAKLEKAFRPPKPASWNSNKNTWLNTYDILYVMNQYEELYKDFAFMGVYPIDFASKNSNKRCIGDSLCEFDITTSIEKKKRFGIVFNTDDSKSPGMHWISLYCNLNLKKPNYGIYFYDSVANPAPSEVVDFMKRVCKQVNDPKFESKENKVQRQFSNYDCGVYSIVFLTQCLKNVKYDTICRGMKHDADVNKLRHVLYRPN